MANDKSYEDKVIYLTELLEKHERPPKLDGFTFTGCQINGPAVVFLMGNVTMSGCRFQNEPEAMLFEVPERSFRVGVIGLANCTFKDCEIAMVGFAGPRAALDEIRAGVA